MVCDRQTDTQTDGHTEVGAPPKNRKKKKEENHQIWIDLSANL